jgi:hypothetical protein
MSWLCESMFKCLSIGTACLEFLECESTFKMVDTACLAILGSHESMLVHLLLPSESAEVHADTESSPGQEMAKMLMNPVAVESMLSHCITGNVTEEPARSIYYPMAVATSASGENTTTPGPATGPSADMAGLFSMNSSVMGTAPPGVMACIPDDGADRIFFQYASSNSGEVLQGVTAYVRPRTRLQRPAAPCTKLVHWCRMHVYNVCCTPAGERV